MSSSNIKKSVGIKAPSLSVFPRPRIMSRAPLTTDVNYPNGQMWVYQQGAGTDDIYVLAAKRSGAAAWVNLGGGTGQFDHINVTGNAVIGGNISVAGTVTFGALGAGTLRSSAAGLVSVLADGNDGEVLIGTTGGAAAWATLTAGGGINIAEAAGTITISNPGATGTTFPTDVGGPVAPTAGGATTVEGYDANISTDGATANTIRIRLADDVTTVASLTATDDFNMLGGTCTITSDDNNANAIYLHANAGVNEQINIRADQGTNAASVQLLSDVGGVTISGGLATADAINIVASDAAGGIDVDYGTGGCSFVGANGAFTVETGTAAVNIGADAAAHTVTIGSATGAASTVIQAGTGDLVMTSTDDATLDSAGLLELNSSAGNIGIGNDADAFNINVGTGAAARTITVGNTTGASSVVVDVGTGNLDLGVSATAHTTRLGSTNTTCDTTIQAGTGAMTFTAGGIWDVNAAGAVTIDSSGGTIGMGVDAVAQNINIGTGAAARTITIGNATAASSTVINVGTGNLDLGVSATAHTTRLGSTNTTCDTTIQSGTGAMTFTAGGVFDVNATGATTIDSTGGAISIGAGADAQAINVGTGAAARTITVGNATGATAVVVEAGTGACEFAANATDHQLDMGSTTGVSATTINAGTGGLTLNAAGIVDMVPAVDTQAAAAVTINANAGVGTFTGLTTAAAASQVLTVTNNVCTVGSAILVSCSNLGANDAQMTITRVVPAAGSFTVTVTNNGAAALNGDIILTFWIIAA